MARYFITFECNGEICHTTGDANFPTAEAFYSNNYSKKATDDMAVAFVDGYLDVKVIKDYSGNDRVVMGVRSCLIN